MGIMSFVIKRLLWMAPMLLGVSVIMFCLTILIPGDPALLRLGNFATAEQLQQLRLEMGLDKPSHERYWLYLKGLLQGSWDVHGGRGTLWPMTSRRASRQRLS
jgi:peptide/nickel transport system permease protein